MVCILCDFLDLSAIYGYHCVLISFKSKFVVFYYCQFNFHFNYRLSKSIKIILFKYRRKVKLLMFTRFGSPATAAGIDPCLSNFFYFFVIHKCCFDLYNSERGVVAYTRLPIAMSDFFFFRKCTHLKIRPDCENL